MKNLKTITALAPVSLLYLMVGCSNEPSTTTASEWVAYELCIPDSNRVAAAEWLKETVRAANPMSDEEPEDNIKQAERTCKEIWGVPTLGVRTECNGVWVFVPYDQCTKAQQVAVRNYSSGVK